MGGSSRKRIFILGALLCLLQSAWAQDFQAKLPARALQPQIRQPGIGGAIARAAELPRPIDAINPFAPLSYGTGEDLVYYDEDDPFQRPHRSDARPVGIRLFSIPW